MNIIEPIDAELLNNQDNTKQGKDRSYVKSTPLTHNPTYAEIAREKVENINNNELHGSTYAEIARQAVEDFVESQKS